MNAVTIKTHDDGKHVGLDEPCDQRPDTKLLVLVALDPEEAFREDWFAFSRRAFAQAYSDDEPDYSNAVILEAGPREVRMGGLGRCGF